jgi:hypothetical protein
VADVYLHRGTREETMKLIEDWDMQQHQLLMGTSKDDSVTDKVT